MSTPPPLRLLLVNDHAKTIASLRQALTRAGYAVVAEVDGAAALLQAVERLRPDVVIVDTESPSRDTLEQLALLGEIAPHPVVMFADQGDLPTIEAAVHAGVAAYVVDQADAARLAPIIDLARARFAEDARLRQRLAAAEQQLVERKLIERAKGILMDKRRLSENDAYQALRRQAMREGLRVADLARQLIQAAELLG